MKVKMKVSREIKLDPTQKKVMAEYLSGKISTREAGKLLGGSHQTIINLAGSFALQWYQTGKIAL